MGTSSRAIARCGLSPQARNYTALLTVFLTETPATLSGNVGVYPGAHVKIQQAFHNAGGVQRFFNEQRDIHDLRRDVTLAEPVQLQVQPGDVLISHYSMPLVAVPNVSPHVRAMVCFRLYHASHVPGVYRPDAMDDIWLEYDGMREYAPASRPSTAMMPIGTLPAYAPAGQSGAVRPAVPNAPVAGGPAVLAAAAALMTMPAAPISHEPGPGAIPVATRPCPACRAMVAAPSRFCPNCGNRLM